MPSVTFVCASKGHTRGAPEASRFGASCGRSPCIASKRSQHAHQSRLICCIAHRTFGDAPSLFSKRKNSRLLEEILIVLADRYQPSLCCVQGNESGSMVKATNCLARRAFEIGAEWSYRLNDDSWLQTPNWGTALTHALTERSRRVLPAVVPRHVNSSVRPAAVGRRRDQRLHEQAPQRPILGVVGPFCPDGKQRTEGGHIILVMDLVRCLPKILAAEPLPVAPCSRNPNERRPTD